jgi:hypothetical protein
MANRICECTDDSCPSHEGKNRCTVLSTVTLYRVDMADETGTRFCNECCEDALESGLFTAIEDCPDCNGCGEVCTVCNEVPDNCDCEFNQENYDECLMCHGTGKVSA